MGYFVYFVLCSFRFEDEYGSGYKLIGSHHDRKAKMSVGEWDKWWETIKSQSDPLTIIYLVNIDLTDTDRRIINDDKSSPLAENKSIGEMGYFCLSHYIRMAYGPDIRIPPTGGKLYLSPPVSGHILTPPHMDGYGTQLSTHYVFFGTGCYNRVDSWSPMVRQFILQLSIACNSFIHSIIMFVH